MRFAARRTLLRWLFLLGCALPTAFTGSAAVCVRLPCYVALRKAALERRLSHALGMAVSIGRSARQGDGQLILHRLALRDRETGTRLASVRSLAAVATTQALTVVLHQPEVEQATLGRLAALLHEHVLARRSEGRRVELRASALMLAGADCVESLAKCHFSVSGAEKGTEALLQFHMPGAADPKPVRLRLVRRRAPAPPTTAWELHTGPTALPCSVARPWLPQLARAGAEATYRGSVWAEQGEDGWNVELAGTWKQLDLDRLVTGHFPHKLSGAAELELQRSTWRRGRLVEASGRLRSEGGVISTSLLDAAQANLNVDWHGQPDGAMLVRYRLLDLTFALDAKRLILVGRAGDADEVLTGEQGTLLASRQDGAVLPVALVRALVPQSEIAVPATTHTAWLVNTLPLPPVVPPPAETARAPYVPLRLRR